MRIRRFLKKFLKTATRGHKLLKDKRDEMIRQFIIFIRRNHDLRVEVEDALFNAMRRFSKAQISMGIFKTQEALFYPAEAVKVAVSKLNVMSVDVPQFEDKSTGGEIDLPYGFAYTSSELDGAVLDIVSLMPKLIELASVEKKCNLLAIEIEKTRRRVNALEYVMIPETQEGIKYITMKLEENDRASLVRLMKAKELLMKDA